MKIIAYQILTATSPGDLEDYVNQAIQDGWQPLGGVSFSPTTGMHTTAPYNYRQAMVKYESN